MFIIYVPAVSVSCISIKCDFKLAYNHVSYYIDTLPVFSCQQTYKRAAHDLHMTHKIGLVEALCGFQFTLKHLDGRQIVVKYAAGKVIEPGKNFIFFLVLHVEDDTTACEY